MGNLPAIFPLPDSLRWEAGFFGHVGGPTESCKNLIDDGHGSILSRNRITMQAGNSDDYPIMSNALGIPSWQTVPVGTSGLDLPAIKARMKELRVTQADVARHLGLNQSAVSNLLNGNRQVKVHEASALYDFLKITQTPSVHIIPVIGLTSAGNWREAILTPGGVMPVPTSVAGRPVSNRAFAVEVKGDSMDRLIPDGGYAVVDPDQVQLYSDKVYLIQNGEHETQVKLYKSNPSRFEPVSTNELHTTLFMGEDPVTVIGRVVWQGAPV